MSKQVYDKLIRDKIPEIIQTEGRKIELRKALNDQEFKDYLAKKLVEESKEFVSNLNIEELADILEIIFSLLELDGLTFDQLNNLCDKKRNERGSFKERTILLSVSK